MFHISIIAETT